MSTLKHEMANQYPSPTGKTAENFKIVKLNDACVTSSSRKWKVAVILAILFLVISCPAVYKITDGLLGKYVGPLADMNGCPTHLGMGIHAIVFLLVIRFLSK